MKTTFDETQIRAQLATVRYPGFSRDIVSFGLVKEIRVEGAQVLVQMALTTSEVAECRSVGRRR